MSHSSTLKWTLEHINLWAQFCGCDTKRNHHNEHYYAHSALCVHQTKKMTWILIWTTFAPTKKQLQIFIFVWTAQKRRRRFGCDPLNTSSRGRWYISVDPAWSRVMHKFSVPWLLELIFSNGTEVENSAQNVSATAVKSEGGSNTMKVPTIATYITVSFFMSTVCWDITAVSSYKPVVKNRASSDRVKLCTDSDSINVNLCKRRASKTILNPNYTIHGI